MRLALVILLVTTLVHAEEPLVLIDFEKGEPADGWEIRNLGLAEIAVPDGKTVSAGRALRLISQGGRGSIQRDVAARDWRRFRALSLHLKVDSKAPVELRIIAVRRPGPAGLLRRFTVEPGDWREVVLPLKHFRESIYDQVCDFSRMDRIFLRWDKGDGSVSFDDVRLLPGKRGVLSCTPTIEDRQRLGFGAAAKPKAFESEHFVVLTDVPGASKDAVAPLLARLEEGLALLEKRYGVGGAFDDKVPLYIFAAYETYQAAIPRIGKHYRAGISAPRAQGYSFFGAGLSVYVPSKGWDRPVFLHEAMHGVLHRRLGVASNGNWIQEGLAPAVQVHLHPSSLSRAKFAANFKPEGGWLRPWSEVLAKPGISTRNYPQTLSMIEFLQDRHRAKLPAIWTAIRKLRGPMHREAMPAIAAALGIEVAALERDWLAWGPGYYSR